MTTVAFCCDLGPRLGTGHLMRCLALAEELAHRGVTCVFVADFDAVPWAAAQAEQRGVERVSAPEGPIGWADRLQSVSPDAVVIDSYELPSDVSAGLAPGLPVLAIVDHDLRGLRADLYVDQNLGAEAVHGPDVMAGVTFALLRDEVLDLRPPDRPSTLPEPRVPTLLCYFGGTDAFAAGPVVAAALAATDLPVVATIVAPRPELRAAIDAVAWRPDQHVTAIEPPPSLMRLVVEADVVVSASGTSLAELLCLGAASAVTPVVDNQLAGYAEAVDQGLVVGLGPLAQIAADPPAAAAALRDLLRDGARQAELRRRGWDLVDGLGRGRVADALLALVRPT